MFLDDFFYFLKISRKRDKISPRTEMGLCQWEERERSFRRAGSKYVFPLGKWKYTFPPGRWEQTLFSREIKSKLFSSREMRENLSYLGDRGANVPLQRDGTVRSHSPSFSLIYFTCVTVQAFSSRYGMPEKYLPAGNNMQVEKRIGTQLTSSL